MTTAPEWVIERFAPPAGDAYTDAELAPLEPLLQALMDRHRDVWDVLPMRSYEDAWERRRAQYRDTLAAPGSFALVARHGERLVGYAVVAIQEGDETFVSGKRLAEFSTPSVLPEERGHGLGAALLDEVERRLLADGVEDLLVGTMHGNDAALRFYERRGFTPFVHLQYRKLKEA